MKMTRDELSEALVFYIRECKELKQSYEKAIKLGAKQITIPLEVGETGVLNLRCCNETHEVELTIHEHMLWACPSCKTVWAIRNMAASAEEE